MSTSPRRTGPASWRPPLRPLLLVVGAVAIGVLLFLMLWWRDRDNAFYRAEDLPRTSEGQQFEPLPAPLPAGQGGENASGLGSAADRGEARPTDLGRPPAAPAAPAPPPAPAPPTAIANVEVPVPVDSPAPRYPREALRSGESGTVLLRVHVGADGRPTQVDLVESSRSRSLDRAATEAVRRWRFRPAQRNGQPVPGVVQVPIAFNAEG